jgi:hypothetical protein
MLELLVYVSLSLYFCLNQKQFHAGAAVLGQVTLFILSESITIFRSGLSLYFCLNQKQFHAGASVLGQVSLFIFLAFNNNFMLELLV